MKSAVFLKSHYGKLVILAAVFLFLVAVFGNEARMFAIVPFLVALGASSMFYHHFFRSPINFEMIKLVTVLSSVAYGIPAGIFVGFSSNLLGHVLAGKIDDTLITSFAGNAIMAVVAGSLSVTSMLWVGMVAVIANYALIIPFIFIFGRNLGHAAVWIVSNLLFNFLLFSHAAPLLIKLL